MLKIRKNRGIRKTIVLMYFPAEIIELVWHFYQMANNRKWLEVLFVLLMAGVVRGGLHVVKVIVLAGLGLAGMWMLHTLAQDYDKISNKFMFGSSSKAPVGKRSIDAPIDVPGVSTQPSLPSP